MTALADTGAVRASNRAQTITGWVLSIRRTFRELGDLDGVTPPGGLIEQTGRQLGMPAGSGLPIGVGEAVLLALYLFPRTSVLGAVLFTGLFGGTAATHWLAGNPLPSHILFGVYLGVFAWGGLWVRDARLREVFPFRR